MLVLLLSCLVSGVASRSTAGGSRPSAAGVEHPGARRLLVLLTLRPPATPIPLGLVQRKATPVAPGCLLRRNGDAPPAQPLPADPSSDGPSARSDDHAAASDQMLRPGGASRSLRRQGCLRAQCPCPPARLAASAVRRRAQQSVDRSDVSSTNHARVGT